MSLFQAHHNTPIAAKPLAPIKGYNRRSFVIGWTLIVAVAAIGFLILSLPIDYSTISAL